MIDASLAIADERGLDAVTMKAVADRLSVTPMALYRHVTNKADLLDGVVESSSPSLRFLRQICPGASVSQRRSAPCALSPNVTPMSFRCSSSCRPTPPWHAVSERKCRNWLLEVGVAEEGVGSAERILTTLIFGYAVSEATGRFSGHSKAEIDRDYAVIEAVVEQTLSEGGWSLAPDEPNSRRQSTRQVEDHLLPPGEPQKVNTSELKDAAPWSSTSDSVDCCFAARAVALKAFRDCLGISF